MKRFAMLALSFALFVFSAACYAAPTPTCASGAWYDPATSGSGFFVEVSADVQAVAWFTFDAGAPIWFTAQGSPSDTVLDLYATSGKSAALPATGSNKVGSLQFVIVDANNATINYSTAYPAPWCSGFGPLDPLCSGTRNVVRLVAPNPC